MDIRYVTDVKMSLVDLQLQRLIVQLPQSLRFESCHPVCVQATLHANAPGCLRMTGLFPAGPGEH